MAERQADRRTHYDSIYRASTASCGKKNCVAAAYGSFNRIWKGYRSVLHFHLEFSVLHFPQCSLLAHVVPHCYPCILTAPRLPFPHFCRLVKLTVYTVYVSLVGLYVRYLSALSFTVGLSCTKLYKNTGFFRHHHPLLL